MTPKITKSQTDTGKYIDADPPKTTSASLWNTSVAGSADNADSTPAQGANPTTKGATDMTDGIHEGAKQTTSSGDKMTGQGTSVFSQHGAIGQAFRADGIIGGTAQAVGGPFDKQGVIGKHFNADGAIGGTAQGLAEKNESH